MGAALKKQKQEKKKAPKLKVVKTTEKKVAAAKPEPKKEPEKVERARRGRPPKADKEATYNTIIRFPLDIGERLKLAAKKNKLSLNKAVITIATVWLEEIGI